MSNENNKIRELEALINKELNDAVDCNRFKHICRIIETETGRNKVADKVKELILFEEFDDIQACLTHLEDIYDMS